jgi:hypothetical protein
MFALIELNGATHIAINIPHEGAEKSLPAIAAMLEKNSTFIRQNYSEMVTVQPSMQIILGDEYTHKNYNEELFITIPDNDSSVIDDTFQIATVDVFVSNAKRIKDKEDEIVKINKDLSFYKSESEILKDRIAALLDENEKLLDKLSDK